MKKQVYIHIGYFKTGTSAVQRYFGKYRAELANLGISYPEAGGPGAPPAHHDLALSMIREAGMFLPLWFRTRDDIMHTSSEKLWADLSREIDRAKQKKIFISSEEFARFGGSEKTKKSITRIQEYLAEYDVKVICYLRRQDDYYESFYNTTVKGLEQKTIQECMSIFEEIHFDYLTALDPWEEIFGREHMIVRLYDREELGLGIVPDILDAMEVAGCPADTGETSRVANLRIDNRYLEIKRWLNHFNTGGPWERLAQNMRIRNLFRALDAIEQPMAKSGCRLLSYEERTAMMKKNEETNRTISERYFDGKWPLFKPVDEAERETPVAGEPATEDILRVVLGMVTDIYLDEGDFNADADLLQRVKELESSRSWRYTAPLRALSSLFLKKRR